MDEIQKKYYVSDNLKLEIGGDQRISHFLLQIIEMLPGIILMLFTSLS